MLLLQIRDLEAQLESKTSIITHMSQQLHRLKHSGNCVIRVRWQPVYSTLARCTVYELIAAASHYYHHSPPFTPHSHPHVHAPVLLAPTAPRNLPTGASKLRHAVAATAAAAAAAAAAADEPGTGSTHTGPAMAQSATATTGRRHTHTLGAGARKAVIQHLGNRRAEISAEAWGTAAPHAQQAAAVAPPVKVQCVLARLHQRSLPHPTAATLESTVLSEGSSDQANDWQARQGVYPLPEHHASRKRRLHQGLSTSARPCTSMSVHWVAHCDLSVTLVVNLRVGHVVLRCVLVQVKYAPGDVVTRQGEPGNNYFIVKSGVVRIIMSRDNGPGEVVGQVLYTMHPTNTHTHISSLLSALD